MEKIYSIEIEQAHFIPKNIIHYFYQIGDKIFCSEHTYQYLKNQQLDSILNLAQQIDFPKQFLTKGKKRIFLKLRSLLQDRIPNDTIVEFLLLANSLKGNFKLVFDGRSAQIHKHMFTKFKQENIEQNIIYFHDYIGSKRIYIFKIQNRKNRFKLTDKILWTLIADYKFLMPPTNYKMTTKFIIFAVVELFVFALFIYGFNYFKLATTDPNFTWSFVISLIVPVLIFMEFNKIHLSDIGFNKNNILMTILFSLVISGIIFGLFYFISLFYIQKSFLENASEIIKNYQIHHGHVVLLSIAYLFLTTFQEMFRSFVQTTLQRFVFKRPNNIYSVLFASIGFGLCHIYVSLSISLLTFVFGFFLGTMYQRQKNIYGTIIVHYVFGMFSWLFGYLG